MCFQAVDKDKSGEISVEEFKLFFQCLGLTSEVRIGLSQVLRNLFEKIRKSEVFTFFSHQTYEQYTKRKKN